MELFGAFSSTAKLDNRIEEILNKRKPSEPNRDTESAVVIRKEKKIYNKICNATVIIERREQRR